MPFIFLVRNMPAGKVIFEYCCQNEVEGYLFLTMPWNPHLSIVKIGFKQMFQGCPQSKVKMRSYNVLKCLTFFFVYKQILSKCRRKHYLTKKGHCHQRITMLLRGLHDLQQIMFRLSEMCQSNIHMNAQVSQQSITQGKTLTAQPCLLPVVHHGAISSPG